MRKLIVLFSFLFLCGAAFGQLSQFRMIGSGSWTTVNDSTFSSTVTIQSDLTSNGFLPTGITDTMKIFSQTGQRYRISSATNLTFSGADLIVVESGGDWGAPVGQVMIYENNGREAVPNIPFSATGATAKMQEAVDTYNSSLIGSGGATTFSSLTDSPANYIGQANKMVLVNSGESGLIFADTAGLGGGGSASSVSTGIIKQTINEIGENGFNRSDQSSLVQVSGDTLLLTYIAFPGVAADFGGSYIVGKYSYDSGYTFGDTVTIQSTPTGYESVTHPSVVNLGNDSLILLTRAIESVTPYFDSEIFKSISADGGSTWSTPELIMPDDTLYYVPTSDPLIKTYEGRLLCPYSVNINDTPYSGPGNYSTRFLYSDDNGATWSINSADLMPIGAENSQNDSMFVEVGVYQLPYDSSIVAYGRTKLNWVFQSESFDNGDTWSAVHRYPLQTGNSQAKIEFVDSLGVAVAARNGLQYTESGTVYSDNIFSRRYMDIMISATTKEFKVGESFRQLMRLEERDSDNNPLILIEPSIQTIGDKVHIFYSKGSSDLVKYSLEHIIIPFNSLLGDFSGEVVGDLYSSGRLSLNSHDELNLRPRTYLDVIIDSKYGNIPTLEDIGGLVFSNNEDGGFLAFGEANAITPGSWNRVKSLSKESGVAGLEFFSYVNPNGLSEPVFKFTAIDDDLSGPIGDGEKAFSIFNSTSSLIDVYGDGHTDFFGVLDASGFSDVKLDLGTATGSPSPKFEIINEGGAGFFLPRIRVTPSGTNNNFQIISTTNPLDTDEPGFELILEDGAQGGAGEIPDGQPAINVSNSFSNNIFTLYGNGDLLIDGNLTANFNDITVTNPASTDGIKIDDAESGGYFRIVEGTGGAGSFFPRIQSLPIGATLYTQWQSRRANGASSSIPNIRLQVQNTAGNGVIGDTELGFELMNNTVSLQRNYGNGDMDIAGKLDVESGQMDFGNIKIYTGTGSPEGVLTANIGSKYIDESSGSWYRKNTGSGNSGWQIQTTGTDDQTASEVNITDVGGYFTGTEVEAALQELGARNEPELNIQVISSTATYEPTKGTLLVFAMISASQTVTLDPSSISTGTQIRIQVNNDHDCTIATTTGTFVNTNSSTATRALTEGTYTVTWGGTFWYFEKHDIMPSEAFMSVVGGATSFVSGTPERIDGDTPGTTTDVVSTVDMTVASSRVTYTGADTKNFHVIGSISSATTSASEVTYYVAVNGSTIGTGERRDHSNSDTGYAGVQWVVSLSTNDYVEIYVDAVADETTDISTYNITVKEW